MGSEMCIRDRPPSGAPWTLLLGAASGGSVLPRSKSGTYRRTSHDAPCSTGNHPGKRKHTLIKSNYMQHGPTPGQNRATHTDGRAPTKKSPLNVSAFVSPCMKPPANINSNTSRCTARRPNQGSVMTHLLMRLSTW